MFKRLGERLCMWNSTKIKREQRRLDDMVTKVGMPPSWEAIGRDKKGWVYRWRKGESFVEHCDKRWYWYTGIKTKHMHENGAFTDPVACAVACELTVGDTAHLKYQGTETGRISGTSWAQLQELPRL